jgi:hypothetical protein
MASHGTTRHDTTTSTTPTTTTEHWKHCLTIHGNALLCTTLHVTLRHNQVSNHLLTMSLTDTTSKEAKQSALIQDD